MHQRQEKSKHPETGKVHRPRELKRPANRQLREFEGECEFYLHPALFNQQPDPEPMFQRAA